MPNGCRFVLEQVSGHYTVSSGGPWPLTILENSTAKDELEVREDPHTDNYYRFHQSTRLYFDAGADVGVLVMGFTAASGSVFLSGYLTAMPGDVCDP